VAVPEQLQAGLADRYRIERELGRGGMATVYLAQDLKHDRRVALKLLHPELATTLGPERFLREIHLTARLDHPHILPVFDSGAAGGLLWYTMPYVEGESLRDRLRREGQLPVEEAVRLAREVADALDCAHQAGVVHRDIKPENILLARGHARVADFGVARAVEAAGAGQLTETGLAVGTPAYMSPEQASGGSVDARSDLYSLGCVLYEMLVGEAPYTGPSAQAITAKRLSGEIPSMRRVRPAVSEPLEQVITKALARIPADRFQTAAELAQALDGSATASTVAHSGVAHPGNTAMRASRSRLPARILTLAVGFLVGLGVLFAWKRTHAGPEAAGPIRVAVLPFDNLGDSADAYFADGVTDAVRGKLAGLPQFQVTASTSSNQYRRTTKTPQEIARELGVDYLLVGRIRWAKRPDGTSRVQVSPELVRVASASTTWQEPFDASLTDVFQVQADIASRVAGALGVALGAREQTALTARPTHDVAAYDAFLRGERERHEVNADAVRRAIAAYEEAVARDSTFATAWARLAEARFVGSRLGMEGNVPRAREAAERALQLAPHAAGGYAAMSLIVQFRDFPKCLELIRRAHALAPNDAEVLSRLASAEAWTGDDQTALGHLARARELDPQSVNVASDAAYALLDLHRPAEAQHEVERGLAIEPSNATLLTTEALAALAEGDTVSARSVVARLGTRVETAAVMALLWRTPWLLDEEQQRMYLHLPPDPFGGNRTWQANAFAILLRVRGDSIGMRAYADSGVQTSEGWAWDSDQYPPPFRQAIRGMLLGMGGRPREAHAEATGAVRALSDRYSRRGAAYIKHLAAWADVLAGEKESAITLLEQVVAAPYWVTPAYLRVDPIWAPLRGNPRFERLLGTKHQ
jgi:TolB-like protein/tetratricopeptide (TPR) repeat protein/tRNA A-37 threonylcarbamoyl transferase component Bud32